MLGPVPLTIYSRFQRFRVTFATIAALLLLPRRSQAQIASTDYIGPFCACGLAGNCCRDSLTVNVVTQPQLGSSSGFTTFSLRNAGLAVAVGDAQAGFAKPNAADTLLAIEFPQNLTARGLIVTACLASPWSLPSGELIANTSLALVANCFAGIAATGGDSDGGFPSLSLPALGILALGSEPDADGCSTAVLELPSLQLRSVFVHAEPVLPPWVQPQLLAISTSSPAAGSNSSCELSISWQFVTAPMPPAQADSQVFQSAAAGAESNFSATPSSSPSPSAWQTAPSLPSRSAAPSLAVRTQPSCAAQAVSSAAAASSSASAATASATPAQQPEDGLSAGAVCAVAQWEAAEPCDAACGGGLQLSNRQVWVIDAAAGGASASPVPSQAALVYCGPSLPPAVTRLSCNTLACPSPDGQSRPFIAFASVMQATGAGAGAGAAAAANYSSATPAGRARRAAFRAALAAALSAAAAVQASPQASPLARAGASGGAQAQARRVQAAATASPSATAAAAVASVNVTFTAADVILGDPMVRHWQPLRPCHSDVTSCCHPDSEWRLRLGTVDRLLLYAAAESALRLRQ